MPKGVAGSRSLPISQRQPRITKGRLLTQALIAALSEIDPNTQMPKFRRIVERVVERAVSSVDLDMEAVGFIFDRVEGKPVQAVQMTGRDEGPVESVTMNMSLQDMARLYSQMVGDPSVGMLLVPEEGDAPEEQVVEPVVDAEDEAA